MLKAPRKRFNWGGEFIPTPRMQTPQNAAQVAHAIRRARAEGTRIRPVGSRYALSDVGIGDGIMLDLSGVAGHRPWLRTDDLGQPLVVVDASMRLNTLHQYLAEQGYALATTPNFTGVTVIGGCATGSHGASFEAQPLGAYVQAYELIDGTGRHRWVESSATAGAAPRGHVPVEVDDALFASLGVGVGAFGAILRVAIRVQRRFYIVEHRERTTWRDAARRYIDGELTALDAATCNLCPYVVNGIRPAVLTLQSQRDTLPGGAPYGGDRPIALMRMYARMLVAMAEFRLAPMRIPELLHNAIDLFLPERHAAADAASLMGTDYMGLPPRGLGLEMAMPFDRHSRASREAFVERVETLFEHLEQARARGRFLGGYITLRFAARWDAPLSMSHGSDVAFLELLNLDGSPRQRDVLRDLEDAMRPYGMRRHLGLVHHHQPGELATLYPDLDRFMAARDRVDPDRVFSNAWLDRNLTRPQHETSQLHALPDLSSERALDLAG